MRARPKDVVAKAGTAMNLASTLPQTLSLGARSTYHFLRGNQLLTMENDG